MPETTDVREVPLTRGFVAIVDAVDYDAVMSAGSWCAKKGHKTWYGWRTTTVGGRQQGTLLHRFLLDAPLIDHIDGDGLNCRRSNLRPATTSQNLKNRGPNSTNRCGYKGVEWRPAAGDWRARITVGGKLRRLGSFPTAEDAARAYNDAALEHFGEFAWLNPLPGGAV